MAVPEPLRSALKRCFHDHCWASSWDSFEGFLRSFVDGLAPAEQRRFRSQFADAIVNRTLTAAEYHEITRSEHVHPGDEEQLHDWLSTCWRIFYHDDSDPAHYVDVG